MVQYNVDLHHATILVTGSSGFIGSNLCKRLMNDFPQAKVVGIDNMNDYYDVRLKEWRVEELSKYPQYTFVKGDIADAALVNSLFAKYHFDVVVNLAAQAGVRYSIDHPESYIHSNIVGFFNILEACRHSYDDIPANDAANGAAGTNIKARTESIDSADSEKSSEDDGFGKGAESRNSENGAADRSQDAAHDSVPEETAYHGVQHLVYASSSSVYGGNTKVPFSTADQVDTPVSLYAATKKSNELMAHAYAKLYGIPCTGLRFFSVYGPAGRPDMALFKFTDLFVEDKNIEVYNYGHCKRDFTYIDDIVEGVTRVMQHAPEENAVGAKYKVYNIGHAKPEELLDFVQILEEDLVKEQVLPADFDFQAHTKYLPMQPGDVYENYADSSELVKDFGYNPSTDIRTGIAAFAKWYKGYMTKA